MTRANPICKLILTEDEKEKEYHFKGDDFGIGLLKGSEIILDKGLQRLHKTPLLALQLSEDHPEKEDSHPNRASQAKSEMN